MEIESQAPEVANEAVADVEINQDSQPNAEEVKLEGEKKYTDEDMQKAIQNRVNRLNKQFEEKAQEAKKLAKMNEAQKNEYEIEKLNNQLREKEAQLNRIQMGQEVIKMLSDESIPSTPELVELLTREDADTTQANVKLFADTVAKMVDDKVRDRLRGKTPKVVTTTTGGGSITKEQIDNIADPVERQRQMAAHGYLYGL